LPLSSPTEEKLNIFCKEIQQLDNSIRFIAIANNLGTLIDILDIAITIFSNMNNNDE